MDPITHILTGGILTQNICKKNFFRQATFIGMLSAEAPDLDFFVHSKLNPLLNLEVHRSFTHSFAFIPIGGLIMTLFFLLLFKAWRPRWKEIFRLSTFAYATHSFLDACTSYGTQLFWPFSSVRISWDILPIVEPVFTTILFLSVLAAYVMSPKVHAVNKASISTAKRISQCGLIIAFLYIVFATFQHHRALTQQNELASSRHHLQTTQNRVLPRFGTLSQWDSLYVYKNQVYLDTIHTHVFGKTQADENFSALLFNAQNTSIPHSALSSVETFIWFTQDYTTALSYNPLILADLRYIQKLPHNPRALWAISWKFNQKYPMKSLRLLPFKCDVGSRCRSE
jgi:inner membrane protein